MKRTINLFLTTLIILVSFAQCKNEDNEVKSFNKEQLIQIENSLTTHGFFWQDRGYAFLFKK